jgi:hypothetical protein
VSIGLVARAASADGTDGLILHAAGFVKGLASISGNQITCQVPTVDTAIEDGSFSMGLWNTFGSPTLFFPDPSNPFGNPCGVWLELRNLMLDQGITIDRVDVRFRIAGALRWRRYLATRNGIATACRRLRTAVFALGTHLDGTAGATSSGSGAPGVAFLQLLPLVSPDLVACLRAQYARLSTSVMTALPLVATVTASATGDVGGRYRSNPVTYTLLLRHACGNGRVDDGEECDASSGDGACRVGPCTQGQCSADLGRACATDADCAGACLPRGDPSECTCAFP